MGLNHLRDIEFRYVIRYTTGKTLLTYRTLEHIETSKDFPLTEGVIIAKDQYTNLDDITRKKVYENDVIEMHYPHIKDSSTGFRKTVVGTVVWNKGKFVLMPFEFSNSYYPINIGVMTKLGDIYHKTEDSKRVKAHA